MHVSVLLHPIVSDLYYCVVPSNDLYHRLLSLLLLVRAGFGITVAVGLLLLMLLLLLLHLPMISLL
jgi:hypothetical protein